MPSPTSSSTSSSTSTTTNVLLIGFGAVAIHFCKILENQFRHSSMSACDVRVVGVADSKGAIVADSLNLQELIKHKQTPGTSVVTFQQHNHKVKQFSTAQEVAKEANYDILIDVSPTNLVTGNPGKECSLIALSRGLKVVFANKAPLVLAWDTLSKYKGMFQYSATVCGGLPVVNVCTRDLPCAKFLKIEGIFNSTSNYILTELQKGNSPEEALQEAKDRGIAEGKVIAH